MMWQRELSVAHYCKFDRALSSAALLLLLLLHTSFPVYIARCAVYHALHRFHSCDGWAVLAVTLFTLLCPSVVRWLRVKTNALRITQYHRCCILYIKCTIFLFILYLTVIWYCQSYSCFTSCYFRTVILLFALMLYRYIISVYFFFTSLSYVCWVICHNACDKPGVLSKWEECHSEGNIDVNPVNPTSTSSRYERYWQELMGPSEAINLWRWSEARWEFWA